MSDKIIDIEDRIERRDLELILEVNKKAIEIETSVVEQNEEIIAHLDNISSNQEKLIENQDKLIEQNEKLLEANDKIERDLFKTRVLYIGGLLTIVAQIIQTFVRH